MYGLLNLYGCAYNAQYPVICMDEKSKQLLEDKRRIIPMKPGSPEKYDGEYKRMGTQNIFVAVEPLAGKRYIKVTDQRKKADFAQFIKELLSFYPEAKKIRLVTDNLNTHFESSFYETFNAREADSLLEKIEFHYTPKHGSWLNMAEIEINIMDRECLNRRIGQKNILKKEIASWAKQRNKERKKITWTFTKKKADKKLSKYYVA
jgi:DDE superfamily endonuclease